MDSISWDISGNIAKLDSEIWTEVITIVQPKPKHLCSFFPDFFRTEHDVSLLKQIEKSIWHHSARAFDRGELTSSSVAILFTHV